MTVAAIQAVAQSFTLRGRVTDQDMNPRGTGYCVGSQARQDSLHITQG